MGITLSRFFYKKQARILMVGLDGSGKTSILYCMKLGEVVSTIPTMGFNVESVDYKGVHYILWDAGGEIKIRPLWRHYIQKTQAIIFVVDSIDRNRIDEAKEELHKILSQEDIAEAALLVMANKSDNLDSMSISELTEKLDLRNLGNRKWHIHSTSIFRRPSLYEALERLSTKLDYQ